MSALAGRVREPVLPVGEVRIGGFGGAQRLREWLHANGIDAVVDATHPFAARMSANAAAACAAAGVAHLVLARPPWPRESHWRSVASVADAVPIVGERVFLTIGRQGVGAFERSPAWFLIRSIDPPTAPLPAHHELLLARGPFTVDDEAQLIARHRIDTLVTKNSGGPQTVAKLAAARAAGIAVVVVERPPLPPGAQVVDTVAAAATWATALR